eukprot:1159197-Pelagomonas_calceolata.AAC.7
MPWGCHGCVSVRCGCPLIVVEAIVELVWAVSIVMWVSVENGCHGDHGSMFMRAPLQSMLKIQSRLRFATQVCCHGVLAEHIMDHPRSGPFNHSQLDLHKCG